MVIAAAIGEAETEYVVYFLLEAYLATANRRAALTTLPARITTLPLVGRHDAQSRAALLTDELDAATNRRDEAGCCAIQDALSVFSAALHRLDALESNRPCAPGDGAEQSPYAYAPAAGGPKASPQA
jgi:hypothetical protein